MIGFVFVLQGAGLLLGLPAFLFILATGRSRWIRLKPNVEQRLIDWATPIVIAEILGSLLFLAGCALEGSWLAFGVIAVLDIMSTIILIHVAWRAQRDLDVRSADAAGMFWCRDCVEVHGLDDGCYADEKVGGRHG